ncbi:hypothetical protein M4R22_02135 [Acidovorax sp. GBBC 3334]|uniref:hypothetical protein n=1 Tax=Acidovorax sp. GBBC 3334 TaxID=2940496 RepID=UPI00230399DD|nr:hypothetical protein [Acidovorax sp. GBBC 3334]MDA8453552.1 hypothetical protein [Acidovorax sp. GBBC 3334]
MLRSAPSAPGVRRPAIGRRLRTAAALLWLAAGLPQAWAAAPAPVAAAPRPPLILAPTIVGMEVCDDVASDPTVTDFEAAAARCRQLGRTGARAVRELLDTLEPGGPAGDVQVGFTATLQLLGLYRRTPRGWEIDPALVDSYLRLITEVQRPVVVYLAANHFDAVGPLTRELSKDPRNLMLLPDGRAPEVDYFGHRVVPYTLLTDPDIPVNRYRFEALRYVARRLQALPAAVQDRIVAVTLAGEVHQFFPDFENGMGDHRAQKTTDYSAASVEGFRRYLERRDGSLAALNERLGARFASFAQIQAPRRDARADPQVPVLEHYDAAAAGTLAVAGWLWDPRGRIDGLDLYLDARYMGPVPRELHRLDVYRALEAVDTPNVGFRIDLDYRALPPGRHRAQIVARSGPARYRVFEVPFTVLPRDRAAALPTRRPPGVFGMADAGTLEGLLAHIDMPVPHTEPAVLFNPLARDWNDYRAEQVAGWLKAFHAIARDAGLPASKLYSHQILPAVNSSWNPQLFAVEATLERSAPWKHGINLYGGATQNAWVQRFLAERGIQEYGIPEFHPQQWKRDGVALSALQFQRASGARFISPYFFSVIPARLKKNTGQGIDRMELSPGNPQDGSDRFYRALIEFARQ